MQNEQEHGGQAVVQMARSYCGNQMFQYAIKVFLQRTDFDEETRHYCDPVLKQLLPPLLHANDNVNGAVCSRNGFVFPPFIVLERGIPLYEWAQQPRRQMESIVMVEALAELLATLHCAGRVHRDLKPANVLWLTSSMVWRLLDMGIVADIGAAPLARRFASMPLRALMANAGLVCSDSASPAQLLATTTCFACASSGASVMFPVICAHGQ